MILYSIYSVGFVNIVVYFEVFSVAGCVENRGSG